VALNFHLLKTWRPHEKSSLNTNTIGGNPPDSEGSVVSTTSNCEYGTFKFLNTLIATLLNADKNTNDITGSDVRDIWILWGFNGFY